VTLTASPASDSTFAGWSGGCTGTGTYLQPDAERGRVTATFTKKPNPKDTTPPRVQGLKIKVKHHKRTAKITFKGTDPGHGSAGPPFKCKLDKGKFKRCRSPKLYKHLRPRASTTVQIKAIDKAGNVSKPAKKRFKV
jgi:hypothetical protein